MFRTHEALFRPGGRVLALLGALVVTGCGGGGGNGDPQRPDARVDGDGNVIEFDRRALLQHLASGVVVPTYERFVASSDAMASAVDAYCLTLGTDGAPAGDPVAARTAV